MSVYYQEYYMDNNEEDEYAYEEHEDENDYGDYRQDFLEHIIEKVTRENHSDPTEEDILNAPSIYEGFILPEVSYDSGYDSDLHEDEDNPELLPESN